MPIDRPWVGLSSPQRTWGQHPTERVSVERRQSITLLPPSLWSLTLSGEEFVDSGIEAERLTRVAAFAEGDVERA